jgi:hypothetical protein
MADTALTAVNRVGQAQEITILDIPLIAEKDLPFIDPTKGDGFKRIVWNPPAGYHAAMRYGCECALALLRVAPKGDRRQRADEVTFFGNHLRELQERAAAGKSDKSGAHYAAWKFWDVILDFTMQPATAQNIARYRAEWMFAFLAEENYCLRARLSDARKRKHRRGKAVRS